MARKKTTKRVEVDNYSHNGSSRKNIPPAKIAGEGKIPKTKKAVYSYSPHLTPDIRFDSTGSADRLASIVEKACAGQTLSTSERKVLRALARNAEQPWLEWSSKMEENNRCGLEVDPVALHIHERVSSNAIVRAAMREDVQRDLFADPEQEYGEAVQFYKYDVDWAYRLFLGDSLDVMSSLSRRENLAGKVQMIYMDPPYGISYGSNFQPGIKNTIVKDNDSGLTREPEMVKAYRDTWHLGVHSYLSYLRDRLVIARQMLSSTGSIFLQISAENVHRVRQLMDEVFGAENFMSMVTFRTKIPLGTKYLAGISDYLLWYSFDISQMKYRKLFDKRALGADTQFTLLRFPNGEVRSMDRLERTDTSSISDECDSFRLTDLNSSGRTESCVFEFNHLGRSFKPSGNQSWKTNPEGMARLIAAERIAAPGRMPGYIFMHADYPVGELSNLWDDTQGATGKTYVVQTSEKVIQRCMMMTTDPGDLVLDPTCGSGTTAYLAEQWGRRWITIDSSRVALSLARQRLLTAKYDRYRVQGESEHVQGDVSTGVDPRANFVYKKVPHITLGSIARNTNLDPIFEKYAPLLDENLAALNQSLSEVNDIMRAKLVAKLADKMQADGVRAATDADRRRWLLPCTTKAQIKTTFTSRSKLKANHVQVAFDAVPSKGKFEHWHVPFDTDTDWPRSVADAVTEYRRIWRSKMDEVNKCIGANTDHETLVDQPEVVKSVVRVTGPFTVEGVRPEELSINEDGELFDPTPNDWDEDGQNASAYLDRMLQLLRKDGVTFPNNEHRSFARIESLYESEFALHAEGIWEVDNAAKSEDTACDVAIAFGPQYGPVTAEQVEDLVRASRRYDELVIAAFSFDGPSQEIIQESSNPRLKIHMAHIRPDVSPGMDGLLKDTPNSQLFTVFGQPEIEVSTNDDGEVEVELLGVDIYSPLTGEVRSAGASKVAAWFLDSDYDSRCFCVTQAFFPNQKAWDKIAKALGSTADTEAFDAYKGTVSIPFAPGKHRRIAVKVIDPRGNEVMAIRSLEGGK